MLLQCPYCDRKMQNKSGISMHILRVHPGDWKGTLQASIPAGFRLQRSGVVPAVAKKGHRKPPIPGKCPWCPYTSVHPPGLAKHIQFAHPEHWKGSLSVTVGKTDSLRESILAQKREYNRKLREKHVAMGLTSAGKPRKRPLRRLRNLVQSENIPSGRIPAANLPVECPICGSSFRTRNTFGAHIRNVHGKSLFDLPPYSKVVPERVARPGGVISVLGADEAPGAEPGKVTITIADGRTTLVGGGLRDIREAINQLLKE